MATRPTCTAQTARGARCRRRAAEGEALCTVHLGAPVGRKAKLTPEIETRIVKLVEAGSLAEVAAQAQGISRSTFYDWMRRGESTAKRDRPYRDFREAIAKARAAGEARNVTLIARAGAKDWKALAWLLERQNPEVYGKPGVRSAPAGDGGPADGAASDQAGL